MTLLGKTVQLKGLTHKGKNRIREHGDRWTVLAETDRVLFAPTTAGPWLFIAPAGDTLGQESRGSRWIKSTNDTDFIVVILDAGSTTV